MTRTSYSSDLTDRQWSIIEPLIPAAEPGGRCRSVGMRRVIDRILCLHRSVCSCRPRKIMPREFPPWGKVHDYYRRFRLMAPNANAFA